MGVFKCLTLQALYQNPLSDENVYIQEDLTWGATGGSPSDVQVGAWKIVPGTQTIEMWLIVALLCFTNVITWYFNTPIFLKSSSQNQSWSKNRPFSDEFYVNPQMILTRLWIHDVM